MSIKEKSRFDDMAKQDKVRYDQEMTHYMPEGKRGKKKDPNAPKRPPWVDLTHITSITKTVYMQLLWMFIWFWQKCFFYCYLTLYSNILAFLWFIM